MCNSSFYTVSPIYRFNIGMPAGNTMAGGLDKCSIILTSSPTVEIYQSTSNGHINLAAVTLYSNGIAVARSPLGTQLQSPLRISTAVVFNQILINNRMDCCGNRILNTLIRIRNAAGVVMCNSSFAAVSPIYRFDIGPPSGQSTVDGRGNCSIVPSAI